MRILLQQVRRRLYLRSMGVWTVYAYLAADFKHSQQAIDFALKHGITGVQLSVQFVDGEIEEVRLPELEEREPANAPRVGNREFALAAAN
jgi:hypothetical protein